MILLAWGENKEGQRQYAASTTGLGSGTGSTPSGSTEDGPALAPNTVWGPGGLAGLTGQQAHDVWTGALDPSTLLPTRHPPQHPKERADALPSSPPARSSRQGAAGSSGGGGGAGGAASERSTHRRPASPKKAATSHRGAASASARAPSPKASTRPKAASAPASKPTAGVSAGLGLQGELQGGLQGAAGGAAGRGGGARAAAGSASARPGAPKKLVRRHPGTRNYYAILHVDPSATDAEIRSAYHTLAKVWHPDKHASEGAAALEKAERTFKLVARAYQVLSDAKTRNAFDRGVNVDAK